MGSTKFAHIGKFKKLIILNIKYSFLLQYFGTALKGKSFRGVENNWKKKENKKQTKIDE